MDNYPDGVDGSHPYFNDADVAEAEVIDAAADAEAIKRLALAQALFKNVKSMVNTKDEFNLRGQVDAIMAERFAKAKEIGLSPRSFDVEIDGEKVGTYSISTTQASPAETRIELRCENRQRLLAWAVEHGCVTTDMEAVERHFEVTGELPDGCTAVPVEVPAKAGGKIARTSLRIDPEKVEHALGDGLGDATRYLLEGE